MTSLGDRDLFERARLGAKTSLQIRINRGRQTMAELRQASGFHQNPPPLRVVAIAWQREEWRARELVSCRADGCCVQSPFEKECRKTRQPRDSRLPWPGL